jgi:hypothetical protein
MKIKFKLIKIIGSALMVGLIGTSVLVSSTSCGGDSQDSKNNVTFDNVF